MVRPSNQFKLRIAVPPEHSEAVREALAKSGAGRIGNYVACSATIRQTGRFRPLPGSDPAIGEIGKLETVEEELIEAVCPENLVAECVTSVRKVHPYEEPAIDIIRLYEI